MEQEFWEPTQLATIQIVRGCVASFLEIFGFVTATPYFASGKHRLLLTDARVGTTPLVLGFGCGFN